MAAVEGVHAGSINITGNRIRFKVMDVVINVSIFVQRE